MFKTEQQTIETKIRTFCDANGIPLPILEWKPIPFSGEWGISTSFFSTAAAEARAGKKVIVGQRAQEIAGQVKDQIGALAGIRHVEAVKGYLNLYFDTVEYTLRVVDTILEQKDRFGSAAAINQRIMVEFSHPNTHKAFHVGHLRGTILGDAICRILEFSGYDVVRANYPGDMGLHVIKWLWGYLKFHKGEKPPADITKWMGTLYAEASKRLDDEPDLETEVRSVYARWDQRDPEVVALWERTRDWSLEGFRQMYAALDVRFDKYYFNSQEELPGKNIVAELLERDI